MVLSRLFLGCFEAAGCDSVVAGLDTVDPGSGLVSGPTCSPRFCFLAFAACFFGSVGEAAALASRLSASGWSDPGADAFAARFSGLLPEQAWTSSFGFASNCFCSASVCFLALGGRLFGEGLVGESDTCALRFSRRSHSCG